MNCVYYYIIINDNFAINCLCAVLEFIFCECVSERGRNVCTPPGALYQVLALHVERGFECCSPEMKMDSVQSVM